MKAKELLHAIGGISDKHIEGAAPGRNNANKQLSVRPKRRFMRYAAVAACAAVVVGIIIFNNRESQPDWNEYLDLSMPEPFSEAQGVGGGAETALFYLITENADGALGLNDISYYAFVNEEEFFAWFNEAQVEDYLHTPQTSISEYPNIYSFIKAFNIPVKKVKEFYDERLRLHEKTGAYCLPQEGIDALCTLDEAKILEYFVSDYAIYFGGDKAYSPAWMYYHTSDAYKEAGITPEMIKAKREMYNKLPLTEEALTAFNAKLDKVVNSDTE